MQHQTRQIHVFDGFGGFKQSENVLDSSLVVWIDTGSLSGIKGQFEPFMLEKIRCM